MILICIILLIVILTYTQCHDRFFLFPAAFFFSQFFLFLISLEQIPLPILWLADYTSFQFIQALQWGMSKFIRSILRHFAIIAVFVAIYIAYVFQINISLLQATLALKLSSFQIFHLCWSPTDNLLIVTTFFAIAIKYLSQTISILWIIILICMFLKHLSTAIITFATSYMTESRIIRSWIVLIILAIFIPNPL